MSNSLGGITWGEFARYFVPEISDKAVDYLLWEETPYPFANVEYTVKALRRALRTYVNQIPHCDMCSHKTPYHSQHCPYLDLIRCEFCCKKAIGTILIDLRDTSSAGCELKICLGCRNKMSTFLSQVKDLNRRKEKP